MLAAQSSLLKSGRRPLQPKNCTPVIVNINVKANSKVRLWVSDNSNKENEIESLDQSLAEELSAMRGRVERLRIEKEKTEKLLKEKDVLLEMQMQELEKRGEEQKMVELEVDRLYRLNQLRSSSSMRMTSIRSLRDKEEEKKMKENQSLIQGLKKNNEDQEEEETSSWS